MAETILSSPLFQEIILPFLLIFALIFALLEKLKILGEKRQVNAIVAFVIGLIFVSFANVVNLAANLLAFMSIFAVIILIFLLLYGFASGGKELAIPKGLSTAFGIIIGIAIIIALIVFTGYWPVIYDAIVSGDSIITNIIFIAVIIAAIAIVIWKKQ